MGDMGDSNIELQDLSVLHVLIIMMNEGLKLLMFDMLGYGFI